MALALAMDVWCGRGVNVGIRERWGCELPQARPETLLVFLSLPPAFEILDELLPFIILAAAGLQLVDHALRRLLSRHLILES